MTSPVRSVAVRLSLDPSSYIAGATRAERSTLALDRAVSKVGPNAGTSMEKAAAGAGKAEGALGRLNKASGALGFTLGGLAGVGAAVAGAMSVKWAGDYQAALTKLATTAGESQKNLGMVGKGMLDMAGQVGIGADELAKGMYTIDSAGIHGADSLIVLKAAAQGARQEQADLGHVVDAVTTSLHDYHLPASDAAKVTSQLIAAVSNGKTTFDELTGAMHSVEPIAASAGMSIAQTAGALAAMTASGMHADQAAQNLASSIRSFEKPTGTMRDELYQLGIDAQDLSAHLGERGIAGTLQLVSDAIVSKMGPAGKVALDALNKNKAAAQDLVIMMKAMPPALAASSAGLLDGSVSVSAYTKAAKGLGGEQAAMALQFLGLYKSSAGFSNILKTGGPAVQTYIGALGKAVGTSEGLSVALQLTGENAAGANKAIDAVAKAAAQADGSIQGWDEVQHNFNQRLAEAEQGAKSFATYAGQHLLPILTDVLGYVHDHGPAAMHDLGAAFHAAEVAAGPLIAAGGGVLHVFQELPGPMKDVVVALAALKLASSAGLFSRTAADGTATSVGRLSAAAKTAAVSVGSLSSEMSVQQALFAAEARDAELAASGVGSLNRALGATAVAADAADAGLTRVQMMLRGYDVALAETVVAQDAANTGLGRIGAGGATLAARGFSAAKTAGSGLLSMLGGPWGVAIIGATVGIGAFTSAIQNHNKEVQADTDQVTSWYKAMAGGGRGAVDAMGQLRSKQLELAAAQAHLNDLETQSNDPLLRLSRSHAALGVAIGAQKQKIGELSGEVVKGKKAWDDYWNSLTPQQQAAQTVAADEANLALALQTHGAASVEVKNATADYNAALEHQKQLTGQLTAAEQTQIDKINQLATAQLTAVSSQLGAAQAQSSLDDALAQYNKDSGDGQHSTHQLAAESNSLAAQAISTAQAVAKQAVDQAAANGRTDDGTLANSVMLASLRQYATHITGPGHDALVKAINDLQHTTIATGNVQDAVSKMGLNVEATWDKNTRVISGATDQQIKDLQNLGIKVTHLPKGKIVVSTDTGPARAELDRLIAIYKGTTLTLAGNYHVAGLNGQPGGTQTKAAGGPIIGPGTGTSDSVLIAASNGEHMWTAAETAAAGGHAGVAALRRAVLAGGGGRAAGGPIGHFDMYDTMPARLSASAIRQAEASIRSLAAAATFTGGGGGAGSAAIRALGMSIAASMGYGSQFSAIDYIFSHESGWNPTAQNPTSTAYGIPQFLDSTWGPYGGKTSDAGQQIRDGIAYMRDRYGSPNGAASFWAAHHWYEKGTDYVGATGLAGLHQGEAVLTRSDNAALRSIAMRTREMSGGSRGGAGSFGAPNVTVNARVLIGTREITDIVRVEADAVVGEAFAAATTHGAQHP